MQKVLWVFRASSASFTISLVSITCGNRLSSVNVGENALQQKIITTLFVLVILIIISMQSHRYRSNIKMKMVTEDDGAWENPAKIFKQLEMTFLRSNSFFVAAPLTMSFLVEMRKNVKIKEQKQDETKSVVIWMPKFRFCVRSYS